MYIYIYTFKELLAEGFGYLCETHEVTTDDGYILTLHRIIKNATMENEIVSKPVVLLLPGFLASSDSWLFRGPEKDLRKFSRFEFLHVL